MLSVDLHSHSNCSDGQLPPEQLLAEAGKAGVELFSITDHDTLKAYRNTDLDVPSGMQLLVGIELSCTWRRLTIHILGLNVDPGSAVMLEAERRQGKARVQRFETIIKRLQKAGLKIDAKELISAAGDCPGRPHIAKYLVDTAQVKSETQAFDRYLGQGKLGDVKECWPDLVEVVSWITQSGGAAVLAHPIKYGLTRTKLIELTTDFKDAGGQALEVISGQQNPAHTKLLADIANRFELSGSVGSDFHRPQQPWASLGKVAQLPSNVEPVWSQFSIF